MKRIFLSAILTFFAISFSSVGFSQAKRNTTKNEEIIIRKNDDNKTKTTIVIDSNNITINGQPLADYKGDVKVITRNLMNGNFYLFFIHCRIVKLSASHLLSFLNKYIG